MQIKTTKKYIIFIQEQNENQKEEIIARNLELKAKKICSYHAFAVREAQAQRIKYAFAYN